MFGRAFRSAHICVRCQNRIAPQTRPWIEYLGQQPLQKRCQSTGAAQEENDDDQEIPLDETSETPSKKKHQRKSFRTRHWRPPQTAELGVNSLGKPAEVLILPSRERKPKRETDQDNYVKWHEPTDRSQTGVQESIAEENKPVSHHEVHEHINAIKKQIGRDSGYLRPETFTHFRELLREGFNTQQLMSYIGHDRLKGSSKKRRIATLRTGLSTKRDIAAYIMTISWGYKNSESSEEDNVTRKLSYTEGQLDLMLLDRMETVQEISRRRGVKIDFFKSEKCIRLSGPADEVGYVANELKALKQTISTGSVMLPPQVIKLLQPENENEDDTSQDQEDHGVLLLSALEQKHRMILSRNANTMEFTKFAEAEVALLQRDLFALSRASKVEELSIPIVFGGFANTNDALIAAPLQRQLYETDADVYRLVAGSTAVNNTLSEDMREGQRTKFKQKIDEFASHVVRGPVVAPKLSQTARTLIGESSQIRHENCVELGQTCISSPQAMVDHQKPFWKQPSQMTLDSDVPSLPQWLMQQPHWHSSSVNPVQDRVPPRGSLIRLIFECATDEAEIARPALEVYLTHDHGQDGVAKDFSIQRISLIQGQLSNYLLLPDQISDMRFKRQDSLNLFTFGSNPSRHHLPTLAQIAKYVTEAQSQSTIRADVPFGAVLDVDFHARMNLPQGAVSASKSKNAKSVNRTKPTSVRYFLDSAEIVRNTTYQTPGKYPFVLEYTTYEPISSSLSQEPRQTIRIAESPLLNLKSKEHKGNHSDERKERTVSDESITADDSVPEEDSPAKDKTLTTSTGNRNSVERVASLVTAAYDTVLNLSSFSRLATTSTSK